MKKFLLAFITLTLVACNNQQSQQLPESEIIAVVADEAVTADMLKAFLSANGVSNADKETLNKALEALIEEIAMAKIATKKKLPLSREQLNTLKYLQLKSMANNAKQNYLLENEITEEEIQQEYNNTNKNTGGIQFHVHHLLYKDEIQAIKILDTIPNSEAYKVAEKEYLSANPQMRNVGDLGWVTLGQLPESFREVLPITTENTVVDKVLNSRFGAHIVYLEATRTLQPPKLEDVKQGIIQTLKAKKISKFSQLAKAKAHVIIKE